MSAPELSIDRLTRSHRNSFTSVRLDRLVEYRDDPDWLAQAIESPAARFLPQWRGRSLINPEETGRQVMYLERSELDAGFDPPTLLGRDSRHCYFAVAVDDDSQEWWTGREPKQIAVLDTPATGIAQIKEDTGDRKFWTSPAGIGIMAGGGALALLAIAASGSDDNEQQVRPFTP